MIWRYVDKKFLAVILVIKSSDGAAPEVNLRNPLRTGNGECKQAMHPGFETQGKCHQMSKIGVSMAQEKYLRPLKIKKHCAMWVSAIFLYVLFMESTILDFSFLNLRFVALFIKQHQPEEHK